MYKPIFGAIFTIGLTLAVSEGEALPAEVASKKGLVQPKSIMIFGFLEQDAQTIKIRSKTGTYVEDKITFLRDNKIDQDAKMTERKYKLNTKNLKFEKSQPSEFEK